MASDANTARIAGTTALRVIACRHQTARDGRQASDHRRRRDREILVPRPYIQPETQHGLRRRPLLAADP